MTRYIPVDGRIEGHNLPNFSNRYIYEGNTSFYIMAGDRPVIRLAFCRYLLGTLCLTANGKSLEDSTDVDMSYLPGRVDWHLKDDAFGEMNLTVTSPGEGLGLVLYAQAPFRIQFLYGGIQYKKTDAGDEGHRNWNLNILLNDRSLRSTRFDPQWAENNIASDDLYIECPAVNEQLQKRVRMYVASDGDAHVRGTLIAGSFSQLMGIGYNAPLADLRAQFDAGIRRSDRLANEFVVHTPNAHINAACIAAAAELDGAWHPPKTMHGNMSWNVPFVGWLMHGQHIIGHHERSLATLKVYADAMVQEDVPAENVRMNAGCMPGKTSRFYGQGYIQEDQLFYNMQTQFFSQMISAWRYSGSGEMADILRKALRMHLKREDECFDPDGTGLYESVINTWPTDSVCTSGGGAVEETCYVYEAVCAMAALTEGDERAAWLAKAEKIKKAFFDKLWIKDRGYPGAYVEWGGHQRLHEDAWLYSSFLPIQCGILDEFEAAQALYYPTWALQRAENGLFWISNWTPGIWSVRECSAGENMQQAIAGFMAGETSDAMRVLDAMAKHCMNGDVPAQLSAPVLEGATQLTRAVVEGLFGYFPHYPEQRVTIAPQIPFAWDHASMKTSDVSIEYDRHALNVHLAKPAKLQLRLKLYAKQLIAVQGAENWHLEAGIGGRRLVIDLPMTSEAHIALTLQDEQDFEAPILLDHIPEGKLFNPQGIHAASYGAHMAFEAMPEGYWREYRLNLGANAAWDQRVAKQRTPVPADSRFTVLDISPSFNADVTQIFKQQYLSPRPKKGATCEVGYDGFSLWTFPFWDITPPELVIDKTGLLTSAGGIPVRVEANRNIAFTSLWDNYPTRVEIPVHQSAHMAFISIAGSTNPMQCGIENARLTFHYQDGTEEALPLVNPQNYIQLCAYPPRAATSGFEERADVFNRYDADLLKDFTPEVMPLGEKLRMLIITWPLPAEKTLAFVSLEARSPEIVVGIMGITLAQKSEL